MKKEELKVQVSRVITGDSVGRRLKRVQQTVERMASHNQSCCSYTEVCVSDIVMHTGIVEYSYPEAPCYAALPNVNKYQGITPVIVVAGIHEEAFKEVSRRTLDDFFIWLTNRSPYRHVFIGYTLDPKIKAGQVTVRGDHDARLVVNALIAARAAHEEPEIVNRWSRLRDHGLKDEMAFLFGHFLDVKKGKLFYADHYSSHTSFHCSDMTPQSVKNWADCNIVKGKGKMYCELDASYTGVHAMWGTTGDRIDLNIVTTVRKAAIKLNPKLKVDRWGDVTGDAFFTSQQLCEMLKLDQELILKPEFVVAKDVPRFREGTDAAKPRNGLSSRTLRERAFNVFANEIDLDNLPLEMRADHRRDWLRANPLRNFEKKEEPVFIGYPLAGAEPMPDQDIIPDRILEDLAAPIFNERVIRNIGGDIWAPVPRRRMK